MVIERSLQLLASTSQTSLAILLGDVPNPIIERLDPLERSRVTLLIVGVLILGSLMVVVVWLLGRYWRRQIRKPLPPVRPQGDDWAAKPLAPNKPPVSDEMR